MKSCIKITKFPQFMIPLMLLFITPVLSQSEVNSSEFGDSFAIQTLDNDAIEWGPCPEPFKPEECTVTVLHGDPAVGNFDFLFKVAANTDVSTHWHNSPEHMILLSGELHVTYEGEETTILKKGAYAYGPAKKPHAVHCGDAGPCVLFVAMEDPLDAFIIE